MPRLLFKADAPLRQRADFHVKAATDLWIAAEEQEDQTCRQAIRLRACAVRHDKAAERLAIRDQRRREAERWHEKVLAAKTMSDSFYVMNSAIEAGVSPKDLVALQFADAATPSHLLWERAA